MASIELADQAVIIHLSGWEKLPARRAAVTVPVEALSTVSATQDWLSGSFGLRHGGFVVSGLIKVGIWVGLDGTRRLLAMRRRRPTLHLQCDPERTDGLSAILVSTHDAFSVASRLRERVPQ